MRKLKYIAALLVFIFPVTIQAQVKEKIEEAYKLYKSDAYTEAAQKIDEAVAMPKGKTNKVAWHIRGFIYKDLYLNTPNTASDPFTRDECRDLSVESFKNSILYDSDGSLEEQNRKTLKFLAISFFNDASEIIERKEPGEVATANDKYNRYKDLILYLNPDTSLKDKDIEFLLAMSTAHRKIYESDREKYQDHWQLSNDYLMQVLDLDPKNWPALYSLAVSNYNKGVHSLGKLPEVTNIPDIYEIQSESMRSIEVALPYMMRAYEISPDKIEVVRGLKIIYFNLNYEKESNEMKKLEEDLRGSK